MGTGPTNSSAPTTSQVIGGVRNVTTPTPADTQACALQVDASGNLLVANAAGSSGGNVNLTQVGSVNVAQSNGVLTTQRGLADSSVGAGNATAPLANGVIVAAFIPGVAGVYEIFVTAGTGVAGAAADVGNMQLNKTGVAYLRLANPANGSVTLGPFRLTLGVADTLSVVAIGAGTAAVVYTASVTATRIG